MRKNVRQTSILQHSSFRQNGQTNGNGKKNNDNTNCIFAKDFIIIHDISLQQSKPQNK